MATYDIGDIVRVSASFKSLSGSLIDPTSACLVYKAPSGSSSTLVYGTDGALVRDETGIYHVDITATSAGRWDVRWSSSGTGQASEEAYFNVRNRQVP